MRACHCNDCSTLGTSSFVEQICFLEYNVDVDVDVFIGC